MNRFILLAALFSSGPAIANNSVPSTDTNELFVEANRSYDAGNLTKAVTDYESLLQIGLTNGPIYYNLGNAYFKQGDVGASITAYLHATRESPRFADLQANLKTARAEVRDAIDSEEESILTAILFFWYYKLSPSEFGMVAVLANLTFALLLIAAMYLPRNEYIPWLQKITVLLLITSSASFLCRTYFPRKIAVVQASEASVFSGTSNETTVLFKVHSGTEMRVQQSAPGWVRVKVNDQQGWLPETEVDVVSL
ncbi:MAG: tetratricopeptide repeat protein [Myxococcota bacterium]|nr:tetratricopeptide repeat protein [Myxococcota bacterium]